MDIDPRIVAGTKDLMCADDYMNTDIGTQGSSRLVRFSAGAGNRKHISVVGVTVFNASANSTPYINLDLTHGDISDAALTTVHRSVALALEELGVDFLAVSTTALRRIANNDKFFQEVKLVDRDGLQCTFSFRDKHYISGYDANESPPLYFLAELPCAVNSYKEALEALKPESVKRAEALGISILRQGDMFLIPTPYNKDDLKKMDAIFPHEITFDRKIAVVSVDDLNRVMRHYQQTGTSGGAPFFPDANGEQRPVWIHSDGKPYPIDHEGKITVKTVRVRGLYGTAHTAKEMALLPDGTMLAKKEVVHDPKGVLGESRHADHHALELPGRKWYLVARNTVPVAVANRT